MGQIKLIYISFNLKLFEIQSEHEYIWDKIKEGNPQTKERQNKAQTVHRDNTVDFRGAELQKTKQNSIIKSERRDTSPALMGEPKWTHQRLNP